MPASSDCWSIDSVVASARAEWCECQRTDPFDARLPGHSINQPPVGVEEPAPAIVVLPIAQPEQETLARGQAGFFRRSTALVLCRVFPTAHRGLLSDAAPQLNELALRDLLATPNDQRSDGESRHQPRILVWAGAIWALGKTEHCIHHFDTACMKYQYSRLPLLAFLALAAAVVVVLLQPTAHEPVYQGRLLRTWPEGAPAFSARTEAMNDPQAAHEVGVALSRMLPTSAPVLTNILATGIVMAQCRAVDALTTAFSHPQIEGMCRTALLDALRDACCRRSRYRPGSGNRRRSESPGPDNWCRETPV